MSKFKQSSITPEHRGEIGGIVFSKNRYGPYDAVKSKPVNRNTTPQQRVRHYMGELSRIYSYKLNEKQYKGWMNLIHKITLTDTSGNPYKPAARDIFTAFNFNLHEVGLPLMLDPPKKLSVQSFTSFKFEIIADNDDNDILLYFKPAINKDTRIMIFASSALRNSIFFFRDNRFKKIGYIDSSFKSGDSILSLYRSIPAFNYDFAGSFKIAFRLKSVSCSSGFSGDMIESSASIYQNID